MSDLWRIVSGQRRRQRAAERKAAREAERQRDIEREQWYSRMRAENRREMIRAVSDPSLVPSVRAKLLETLLDSR